MKNTSTILQTPPEADIAEISLFGPGIGECIVIHYGNGKWMIIDSCKSPDNIPIALSYLEILGLNAADCVKHILITHFDSDHTGGAFEIVKRCQKAKFHCPSALLKTEYINFAKTYKPTLFNNFDAEVREYNEILDYFINDKTRDKPRHVKVNHLFFEEASPNSKMIALSPSDEAFNQSLAKIAEYTEEITSGNITRSKCRQTRNLNAVATYFTFNNLSVLLGSDLESVDAKKEETNNRTGWGAVFASGIICDLSLKKSQLFKVAHHGSPNGFHRKIPNQLLNNDSISIGTPYSPCRHPTEESIDRILTHSNEFWLTKIVLEKQHDLKRETKKILKNSRYANKFYVSKSNMGHIQIRFSNKDDLQIRVNEHPVRYSRQTQK